MSSGPGLAQEREELRQLAREFAAQELAPSAPGRDEAGEFDPALFGQLAEMGFTGLRTPEELGGLGLDHRAWVAILEELARADAGVAVSLMAQTGPLVDLLIGAGSLDQRAAVLPPLASGDRVGAVGIGDPAGVDSADGRIDLSASGAGASVLQGVERWLVNGAAADLVLILADGPEGAPRCVLLDATADGLSLQPEEGALGLRSAGIASAIADQVPVAAEAHLAGEGGAVAPAVARAAAVTRVGVAAVALGVGTAAVSEAARYAMERKQFGTPIGGFGAIRDKFARATVALAGARALIEAAADRLDRATPGAEGAEAASTAAIVAKIAASDAACMAADEAVQVFGGYGYMSHYPVERSMRDAKVTQLIGGTNAMLREVLAGLVLARVTGER